MLIIIVPHHNGVTYKSLNDKDRWEKKKIKDLTKYRYLYYSFSVVIIIFYRYYI